MFATAQLRCLAPPSYASSYLRGRKPASFVRPSVNRSLRPASLVVVSSAKKLRGRHRPPPRRDRYSSATVEGEEEEEEEGERNVQEIGRFPGSDVPKLDNVTVSQQEKGKVEETPLRGLDVLKALQKAAARKGSGSIRKEKRRGGARRSRGKGGGGESTADRDVDVRPLEIKDDWCPRLEALEKQIQKLQDEQHDH